MYLDDTKFSDDPGEFHYSVQIDTDGLVVYSECCADTMTLETAQAVYVALGAWLKDHECVGEGCANPRRASSETCCSGHQQIVAAVAARTVA